MKILFIHQNFPGQYRALAPSMVKLGHEVMAISSRKETSLQGIPNVSYDNGRGSSKAIHPWMPSTEAAVIRGEAVARTLTQLMKNGFTPDVIVGHAGWGEMMLVRQVAPHARITSFCEYFYNGKGSDVDFDPEFAAAPDAVLRCHVRNLHLTSSLVDSDVGLSPTEWQASQFPAFLRQRIEVCHDGIETHRLTPRDDAWIQLGRDNIKAQMGDEIITFINRNLEPMRGYHSFMRSLPYILSERPNARVILLGGSEVSYGPAPATGGGYKAQFLREVQDKIDLSRVHFVGQVPYATMVNMLRVSAVHVYLTVPFVLSWSMLEAMSLGCCVVGSATPPVQEVITHGQNGLLVDFFDPEAIARQVCDVLDRPKDYKDIRRAARAHVVEHYDYQKVCLPRHHQIITGMAMPA
jgi:glycosyltransferase involved in cell wall biosynthesis